MYLYNKVLPFLVDQVYYFGNAFLGDNTFRPASVPQFTTYEFMTYYKIVPLNV